METGTNAVVAVYSSHGAAEQAVRHLEHAGIPMHNVSIIGKDWQVREDIEGYYHPGDAIKDGAGQGAWFGGVFGLLLGFGFFVLPVGGFLIALGPISGLIAGAIGGAGIGALAGGLISIGVPKDQALKYQSHLEAGSFLVVVHGDGEVAERAHKLLESSSPTSLDLHDQAA